jgi:cbb3-type cytochrome oxidase subunit 3
MRKEKKERKKTKKENMTPPPFFLLLLFFSLLLLLLLLLFLFNQKRKGRENQYNSNSFLPEGQEYIKNGTHSQLPQPPPLPSLFHPVPPPAIPRPPSCKLEKEKPRIHSSSTLPISA